MAKCKYKSELRPDYKCPEDHLSDSKEGYCIFHERSKDKDIEKFNAGIKAKMDKKDYDFTGYYFPEDIDFSKYNEGKFEGPAFFEEAKFQGNAEFDGAEFQGETRFNEAEFQGWAWFEGAKFQGEASFNEAEFRGSALFSRAEFREASFNEAEFQGWALFHRTQFWGTVSFIGAKFERLAFFDGAEFRLRLGLLATEFRHTVSFRGTRFTFQDRAEEAYRKAKISYQREGDYAEAGYYRLLEMRARRKARLERLKNSKTFKEQSPVTKAVHIARVRFLQGLERVLIDWTCGYGEEWWKVILTALALVFGCAVLYYFFFPITSTSPDIQITGIGWGYFKDCLYFSFVTFTTLGYGDLRPMPEVWTRAVASIEAFTGAFMMALFVLCFARKWMR